MRYLSIVLPLLVLSALLPAESVTLTCTVDGVKRTALVYPGTRAKKEPSPVLLAFHGFGANAGNMSRMTMFHKKWPEATVVYPTGLKVMSTRWKKLVPAWQAAPGRDHDRDIRFVEVLLERLGQEYKVDRRRVFATGSSNGALFCYVLLTMRPERFAAFGCVAGAAESVAKATVPRPVMIIHGKIDTTVKIEDAEATRDRIRTLNGCGTDTVEWAPGYLSYRPCASNQPVIWHQHDGGHIWPPDAALMLTRFFKEIPGGVPAPVGVAPDGR